MKRRDAFEEDLVQLLPRLRRFAFALARDGTDADDLVQAAIERALKSRSQWQQGTRLDSWLYRILRNIWIDAGRSKSRKMKVEVDAEAGESVGHDPRSAIDAAIDLRKIMRSMSQLPNEQREVVALILIEGLGYREAAELLDLPIGTVSSRLLRGRNALMILLGEA
jgi:RNA polymerase sigma-70 factor (ECF subfamily)